MIITLDLSLVRKKFLKLQIITIVALTLLSFTGYLLRYIGFNSSFGLSYFFVDNERTVSTWYASALLLLCATLLAAIAVIPTSNRKSYLGHWQSLALIFLYLSLDESISIHETWGKPVGSIIKTDGFLYHAWVIPALLLVGIFLILYLPFLAHLRPKTRYLFKLSGIIYILGALGFEMIGGAVLKISGTKGWIYILSTHFEEGLELLGLSIFLYGLLDYLSVALNNVEIRFSKKA
jgi:hypothetical protein